MPSVGANTVLVRQMDVAGNTSASTSFSFTLDTAAQSPVITGFSDDTDVAGDLKTSDTNLLITGTAEPFATVTLSPSSPCVYARARAPQNRRCGAAPAPRRKQRNKKSALAGAQRGGLARRRARAKGHGPRAPGSGVAAAAAAATTAAAAGERVARHGGCNARRESE